MPGPAEIFDRRLLRRRRDRAAATLPGADFLVAEAGARLAERLDEIRRDFPAALVLGGHRGRLAAAFQDHPRVGSLVVADPAPAMLEGCPAPAVVADEEALPFGPDRFDLVLSAQLLHWVNDLPGTLAQLRYCLKPDGLLLACLPGGETLAELRSALLDAEVELEGGAGPRVSPFLDVREAGSLLQRAGFALPVADLDRVRVSYPDPLGLLRDLRAMGETSALVERRRTLRRGTLARALALYAERHPEAGGTGRVAATFELVFLTGWKPDPAHPRALRRGSAAVSLAQALRPPPPPSGG
jgi:NADH dehydrogenase [ubiquinone] 1 alpha subcomplex assembly factor 5